MHFTGDGVDHELWQSRLSRFGRVLAIVSLAYPGLNIFFSVWMHRPSFNRVSIPPLVASLAFATLWLLLRAAQRPHGFVRAVELSTLDAFAGTVMVDRIAGAPEAGGRAER